MFSFDESVTPDAIIHDPLRPPVNVLHYTYRIPDGHIVPNPPPVEGPKPPSMPSRQMLPGFLAAAVVLVLMAAGIAGVWT